MFKELQLKNIKSFSDTNSLPLSPITLIYGQNSSGKSSLLQSLLMLKQTIEDSEDQDILLQPKGNVVDLGSYREFIHKHESDRLLSVNITVNLSDIPRIDQLINWISSTTLTIQINFGFNERTEKVFLSSTDFYFDDKNKSVFSLIKSESLNQKRPYRRFSPYFSGNRNNNKDVYILGNFDENHDIWKKLYESQVRDYAKFLLEKISNYKITINDIEKDIEDNKSMSKRAITSKKRKIDKLKKRIQRYEQEYIKIEEESFSKNLNSYYSNYLFRYKNFIPVELTEFRDEEFDLFEKDDLLENINFSRYMYGSGKDELPTSIIRIFNFVRESLEGIVYIGPLRDYPERYYIFTGSSMKNVGKTGKMVPNILFKNINLLEKVNQRISNFGINYKLKISYPNSRNSELYDVFAIRLLDNDTESNVSIMDVGFGISQVLPIIVQSMISRKKTLVIEQPEIHLHPRLQSELGNLFADCIKEPYENTFIIETHSEHLILRLQKLIRQGKIKNTDISILYVDKGSNGSECLHLRLDEEGDFIDEWPDGFFEDSYNELFG